MRIKDSHLKILAWANYVTNYINRREYLYKKSEAQGEFESPYITRPLSPYLNYLCEEYK